MQVCPAGGMQARDQAGVHHHPEARDLHRARAEVLRCGDRCLRQCPQTSLQHSSGQGGNKGTQLV